MRLLDARRILEYDTIEQAKKGEQDRSLMTSCWISAGQSDPALLDLRWAISKRQLTLIKFSNAFPKVYHKFIRESLF